MMLVALAPHPEHLPVGLRDAGLLTRTGKGTAKTVTDHSGRVVAAAAATAPVGMEILGYLLAWMTFQKIHLAPERKRPPMLMNHATSPAESVTVVAQTKIVSVDVRMTDPTVNPESLAAGSASETGTVIDGIETETPIETVAAKTATRVEAKSVTGIVGIALENGSGIASAPAAIVHCLSTVVIILKPDA